MSPDSTPSFWKLSTVSFIVTSGINLITVLPMMVGAVQDQYGFSRQALGLFASADTLGVCLCGLAMFYLLSHYAIKPLIVTGLTGLIIFHSLSIIITTPWILTAVRLGAGFTGGMAYVAALAWFAKTPFPQQGYANYIVIYSLYSASLLVLFPVILKFGGVQTGWGILLILTGLAWWMAGKITWEHNENQEFKLNHEPVKFTLLLWLLFFGFVTFQAGNSSLYSFMERIGNEKNIDPILNGIAISSSIGTGLAAGFLVPKLSRRFYSDHQVLIGLFIMLMCNVILIFGPPGFWSFLFAVALFGFGFNLALPNFLNLFARIDRTGRALALGTVTNWMGQSIGPLLGALMLGARPFLTIVYPSALFLVLAFLTLYLFTKKDSAGT